MVILNVLFTSLQAIYGKDNDLCVIVQAFFITNLEPRNYWEFASQIYEGLGYKRCADGALFFP